MLADDFADDRVAVQAAIDFQYGVGGGTVELANGIHRLALTGDGVGASALILKSNVEIVGQSNGSSVLKLADSQLGRGTYLRLICTMQNPTNSVALRNFSIDGNRAGQGEFATATNGGLIVLGENYHAGSVDFRKYCYNVVVERITAYEATDDGIQVKGSDLQSSSDVVISNCAVSDCNRIGIQASLCDDLVIAGNVVHRTADNCIDIYNNNGRTTITTGRFEIVNNNVKDGLCGIFPETSAFGVVANNVVEACSMSGIQINRINGEPRAISVASNIVKDCPVGIAIYGDLGGVQVIANILDSYTRCGVRLGGSNGNISYLTLSNNLFRDDDADKPVFEIPTGVVQAAFIQFGENTTLKNTEQSLWLVNGATTSYKVGAPGIISLEGGASGPDLVRQFGQLSKLVVESDAEVGGVIKVDNVQVVMSQRPSIANSVGGDEVTKINAILTALRDHGLIAT